MAKSVSARLTHMATTIITHQLQHTLHMMLMAHMMPTVMMTMPTTITNITVWLQVRSRTSRRWW